MTKLKNEQKYTKIITGGLMYYYFNKGVENLNINIDIKPDYIVINAGGRVKLSSSDLSKLEILKNPMRLPEFENYYDVLIDYNDSSNEISNIDGLSSIIDTSEVDYDGEFLSIKLRRNF